MPCDACTECSRLGPGLDIVKYSAAKSSSKFLAAVFRLLARSFVFLFGIVPLLYRHAAPL